ncbi:MAG: HEAT repeat domain-containing protein [Gemmatimonadales bacterium]
MSGRTRGVALPRAVDALLRELVNALGKTAMYPPGHRFISESAAGLLDRLRDGMADRDTLSIGILPRGLLLDGVAIEPLPGVLRDFAVRMHRRNVGTIHITRGITADEVARVLTGLAASDAEDTVGREGLRTEHARVEPMIYDVLAFGDPLLDSELDDTFWTALVEAAFGRQLRAGESPTAIQIAEAITERAAESVDAARRVFEALSAFSSALAARGRSDQRSGSARRQFVAVLSALSRPTRTRVVAAAPGPASRRRFLRDTLDLVPPALLLQVLESVAEADGEPISPQLRWLLGKLAGADGGPDSAPNGGFTTEVLGLVQQWDGVASDVDEDTDPRLGVQPARTLALGLEMDLASEPVLVAARRLADSGRLLDLFHLADDSHNDPDVARTIIDAVLAPGLVERLVAQPAIEFPLLERVASHVGAAAVDPLLGALGAADERAVRRRLLDILIRIGPASEPSLLQRLIGAPWHLARNILVVMSNLPAIQDVEPVFETLQGSDLRVRQEALKVLVRQTDPQVRERAIVEALDTGEESLARMALTALGGECPPRLVAAVLSILGLPDPEIRLQAIRSLAGTTNPLVVPHLLTLVRARRGLFRRQRLLPKTPVMLAALEVLARRWATHRPVLTTMQLAAGSHDPEIRAIVGAPR